MKIRSCSNQGGVLDGMLSRLHKTAAENPATIQSLVEKSGRFKQAWDEMQKTIEDSLHHGGESSADHTNAVLSALEKIWARDLPQAKAELGGLVAALHDVGKTKTRTVDPEGRVRFLGHAKQSVEMAKEILQEVGAEQAELIQSLIGLHMDLFPALDDPQVVDALSKKDALWKMEGAYAMIDYLVAITRADLESINSPQAAQLDGLLAALRAKRAEVEAAKAAKQQKAEEMARMSPEDFVKGFKGPPKALPGALKGKYPNLSEEERARLLAPRS